MQGKKSYLIAAMLIVLGIVKIFTDIPEIESLSAIGLTDPDDLISTGFLLIAGRSAIDKVGK